MAQAVAYFTGFETGDTSEVAPTSAPTVQSTTVRTGGYAMKLAAAGSASFTYPIGGGLASTNTVWRGYFRTTAAGNTTGFVVALLAVDQNTGIKITFNASRQLVLTSSNSGETATGTTVLAVNTWYRLEVTYDSSTGLGAAAVYVNGNLDSTITETNGIPVTIDLCQHVRDSGADFFFDDIRVDTGGLALIGDGATIARQGIAGTPTYNAWTKNGAATAALCWSDTPFAAATNCSDAVLNDAQTMAVGLFSADPSRAVEGPNYLAAGVTINAVKVAMVAKTASAGSISIRRRQGGVDTDTVKTLTTADAYYQSEIFTDTQANLDSYEIGVKNGHAATSETVEDMWMMVEAASVLTSVPPIVGSFSEQSREMSIIRRAPVMVAY